MKGGMAFFHRDENSATGRANFSTSGECSFDGRAIVGQIDNFRGKKHRIIRRRWPEQFDCIIRRDSARRVVLVRLLHQMTGGRPIAMAIEQRADDAAIQNSRETLRIFFPVSIPRRLRRFAGNSGCAVRPDSPGRNPSRHCSARIVPAEICRPLMTC